MLFSKFTSLEELNERQLSQVAKIEEVSNKASESDSYDDGNFAHVNDSFSVVEGIDARNSKYKELHLIIDTN